MRSAHPLRDGSSSVGPRDTSPLLARSPDSVRRSLGSVDPVAPADRAVAGSPTELAEMPPTVFVPLPATASSYSGDLRSGPPLATGSSSACAPAPCGAGATTVAANRDSPNSVPRSVESHPSAASAEYVVRPGDRSSACVRASCGSRRRRQSTIQSSVPPAVARTSAHVHWLPSPRAPSFPGPRAHGRTSPLPRDGPVAALAVPQFPYLHKQFVQRPGGNLLLSMIIVRLLSPGPFGWLPPPKFTRVQGADIVMESLHSELPMTNNSDFVPGQRIKLSTHINELVRFKLHEIVEM